VQEARCKISAYLSEEELEKFHIQRRARGDITMSGYIREMLGFDVRERGAPTGPRKKNEDSEAPKSMQNEETKSGESNGADRPLNQPSFFDSEQTDKT
jgi:hypothetical protein